MPVPTEGSYKMFDTGSNAKALDTSIRGAQKYNTEDSVNNVNSFSNLIASAQVSLFDERYAGKVSTLSDISSSLQFRGYPASTSTLPPTPTPTPTPTSTPVPPTATPTPTPTSTPTPTPTLDCNLEVNGLIE